MSTTHSPLPPEITNIIHAAAQTNERLILLTCGLSGSGKSTFSRTICSTYPNFTRLSIDKYIFEQYGIFDADYPASIYAELQLEARRKMEEELLRLMKEGEKDVVLDLASYSKSMREKWRGLVDESAGLGRVYEFLIVVFRADEETLWRRIRRREDSGEIRRGEGCVVTREMLRGFLEGFEWPDGEGEVVLKVVDEEVGEGEREG